MGSNQPSTCIATLAVTNGFCVGLQYLRAPYKAKVILDSNDQYCQIVSGNPINNTTMVIQNNLNAAVLGDLSFNSQFCDYLPSTQVYYIYLLV